MKQNFQFWCFGIFLFILVSCGYFGFKSIRIPGGYNFILRKRSINDHLKAVQLGKIKRDLLLQDQVIANECVNKTWNDTIYRESGKHLCFRKMLVSRTFRTQIQLPLNDLKFLTNHILKVRT